MSMKEHRSAAMAGMKSKIARMGGKMGDKKHLERGGKCYATGGAVDPSDIAMGAADGMPSKPMASKPAKHKGKSKHKGKGDTHVNVVVMPKGDGPMPPPGGAMPPPHPMPPPMPPPGPPGPPMGGPPPGGPPMPPGGPMGPGGPPMMHASGGRVGRKTGGKVKRDDGGAVNDGTIGGTSPGQHRADKTKVMRDLGAEEGIRNMNSLDNVAPSMGRAVGGKVRGTKDGAGGGMGREEKIKMYGKGAGKSTGYNK